MVPKKGNYPLSGVCGGKGLAGVGGSEVTLARLVGDQRKPAVAQTRKSIVRKLNQVRTIPELNTTRPDVHKHLFPITGRDPIKKPGRVIVKEEPIPFCQLTFSTRLPSWKSKEKKIHITKQKKNA